MGKGGGLAAGRGDAGVSGGVLEIWTVSINCAKPGMVTAGEGKVEDSC